MESSRTTTVQPINDQDASRFYKLLYDSFTSRYEYDNYLDETLNSILGNDKTGNKLNSILFGSLNGLHLAAKYNNAIKIASLLLEYNIDINATASDRNWTALHFSVERKNIDMVLFLCYSGINVNIISSVYNKETALHMAIRSTRIDIAEIILTLTKPDLTIKDNDGFTVVDLAKRLEDETKRTQFLELLTANRDNSFVLHLASRNNCYHMANLLLSKGIDVNTRDNTGCTPLHYAALYGNISIVKLLCMQENISPDNIDNAGNTPLHLAVMFQHPDCVKLLLMQDKYPDKTIRNFAGKTAADHVAEIQDSFMRTKMTEALSSKQFTNIANIIKEEKTINNREKKKKLERFQSQYDLGLSMPDSLFKDELARSEYIKKSSSKKLQNKKDVKPSSFSSGQSDEYLTILISKLSNIQAATDSDEFSKEIKSIEDILNNMPDKGKARKYIFESLNILRDEVIDLKKDHDENIKSSTSRLDMFIFDILHNMDKMKENDRTDHLKNCLDSIPHDLKSFDLGYNEIISICHQPDIHQGDILREYVVGLLIYQKPEKILAALNQLSSWLSLIPSVIGTLIVKETLLLSKLLKLDISSSEFKQEFLVYLKKSRYSQISLHLENLWKQTKVLIKNETPDKFLKMNELLIRQFPCGLDKIRNKIQRVNHKNLYKTAAYIADELTMQLIREYQTYSWLDYLNFMYTGNKSSPVKQIAVLNNSFESLIKELILVQKDDEHCADLISLLIITAVKCLRHALIPNLAHVWVIIHALKSDSISRLEKVFSLIDKKIMNIYEKLIKLAYNTNENKFNHHNAFSEQYKIILPNLEYNIRRFSSSSESNGEFNLNVVQTAGKVINEFLMIKNSLMVIDASPESDINSWLLERPPLTDKQIDELSYTNKPIYLSANYSLDKLSHDYMVLKLYKFPLYIKYNGVTGYGVNSIKLIRQWMKSMNFHPAEQKVADELINILIAHVNMTEDKKSDNIEQEILNPGKNSFFSKSFSILTKKKNDSQCSTPDELSECNGEIVFGSG